ncbi:MAG: tRNA-i(6)A37 thiotransferase enzyme MiaB [Lachnospiraceae bacterium]|jgi:tRNA-2-methylthio-N6-dimethylallyladenosine synthase|nr:tRNA-i(6)A37 thiotransferase enzyme MiaB [Lachnospiraceae bacterium]
MSNTYNETVNLEITDIDAELENFLLHDKTGEAPVLEPLRQYYFMSRLKEWVSSENEKNKRPLKFLTQTFGCQMNAKDSEKLAGILEKIGYIETDTEEDADFIVYNTCTVRENANMRVYGRLGYLNSLKRKNPNLKIALCGCMMQEDAVVDKIKKSYHFVDIIFGTHNIFKLAELMYSRIRSKRMVIDIWKDTDQIVEDLPSERKYKFKAGVNIMYGCNNFCSYCIVPYVRGRERSRNPEDIIREIKHLVEQGVVEIMLLGQNVNSYGKTLDNPMTFSGLLLEIEKIDGLERVRFMTSHPKDLSDSLIDVMKSSKKICNHIHLPLQSGSTKILGIMNRKYTKEDYLALVDRIKSAMPNISLTTDIIVGFPGETEEDFLETLDVVRKARYDSAYTFLYSKRTGTPAAAMENQVEDEIAKERFNRLLKEIQEISAERTGRDKGTVQKLLVEEVNGQNNSLMTGRLSNNVLVHFPGTSDLIGKIVDVNLKESKGFYYIGEMVE